MQTLEFPQLVVAQVGACSSDGSRTCTQLPNGEFLCAACIRDYQARDWLDAAFEFAESYFAVHPDHWWKRLRRKVEGGVVVDPERLAAELRRLVASGESVPDALRRLQSEARVGYFPLAAALRVVLGVESREARRLVVQAVGGVDSCHDPEPE
jgi:hypothetical protein